MKRYYLFLIAISMGIAAPAIAAESPIPNASFEEPSGAAGGEPAGWWSWNGDYNGVTSDAAKTGAQSIYVSSEAKPECASGILYNFKPVTAGKTYSFSCYVRNSSKDPISGGAYGQVSLEWRKGDKEIDGTRTWGETWGPELSDSDWKLVNVSGAAPDGADSCNLVIQFFNKDGKGTFYADDAVISEK
ncbi:MAG: carbohydrate binding domain-containing protein [Candidatus Omnitrophica bacterium]|nr:carbohydrate binding domain-containing protein [Candidatus Omnitrophota bacterium]MDD5738152.1 carbohydrate binding domain-containing protein [Candidatus Omnitrophota bacterium]